MSTTPPTSKPYVISFRKDLHVFPPSECTFRDLSARPSWLPASVEEFYQIVTGIIISGYLFWAWPVGCILLFIHWLGYWWVPLIALAVYLPYFLKPFHKKLGRPWDAVRTSFLWHSLQQYCQIEAIRLSAPLDPTRRYIFGFYPHNLLLLSRVGMYGGVFDELFPGLDFRVLGASTMFFVPMCRELCLYLGAVDAGKKTALKVLNTQSKSADPLRKGNPLSLCLYPGGVSEMLLTTDQSKQITLVTRKGFVRLALETGTDLVPVFVFNEEKYYAKMHSDWAVQSEKFLWKKLKFPWVWFHGKYFTMLSYQPKGRPLTIVFGEPIRVEKNEKATEEEVDALYQKFHEAIKQLFEQYKTRLGYEKDDSLVLKASDDKPAQHKKDD